MDAATAHLLPEPPALALPPRVPLSCPPAPQWLPPLAAGPWVGSGPSLLSQLLSAPPGGCLPRSPGVSWEHGWYLGTCHPWPHSPMHVSASSSP